MVPSSNTLQTSQSAQLPEKEERVAPRVMRRLLRGVAVVIRHWKKLTPFCLYPIIASCLGIAAVTSEERSVGRVFLLIVLGLLSWSFGEYVIHRFALHFDSHRKRFRYMHTLHLAHHDDPQAVDQLFLSIRLSAPSAAGYCLLAWAILDWQSMSYLFIGVVAGYCCYEWLHFQAHHGASRMFPLRYLKKYHLLHHGETPNLRFGVTSPLFDYLFGTYQSATHRQRF